MVEKHSYVYNGSQLVLETTTTTTTTNSSTTTTTETQHYTYDAGDLPMSLTLTDNSGVSTTYYYATNAQGDVTALLNTSGKAVVEYTYDAWGNPLSTTGTMAFTLGETNSLRYRGYVYDTETGYYYLQSRYYNPEIGRFISADDASCLDLDGMIVGYNLFAYCDNNPVDKVDSTGHFALYVQ